MLRLLDLFLTLIHFLIIGINLFGWILPKTRKFHLIMAGLTLFSWLILGIWFGFGYCPVTDWQWNVKEKLGETNLPNSFIKYFADKIFNSDFDSAMIDTLTGVSFIFVIILSIYLSFFNRKSVVPNNNSKHLRSIKKITHK